MHGGNGQRQFYFFLGPQAEPFLEAGVGSKPIGARVQVPGAEVGSIDGKLQLFFASGEIVEIVDFLRGFCADHQYAADLVIIIPDGAIAECPVYVFDSSVPIDGHQLVLAPGGFSGREYLRDERINNVPDLGPTVFSLLAKCRGVFAFIAQAGPVGVIVKLYKVLSPPQEHGETRGKDGSDSATQALGPVIGGTDGGFSPIILPGPFPHFAATRQKDIALHSVIGVFCEGCFLIL